MHHARPTTVVRGRCESESESESGGGVRRAGGCGSCSITSHFPPPQIHLVDFPHQSHEAKGRYHTPVRRCDPSSHRAALRKVFIARKS